MHQNRCKIGDFLVVQWLRLHVSNARGLSSIPGWGTKISHAMRVAEKKRCEINGELDGAEFCGKEQHMESGQEEGLGCARRSGRPHGEGDASVGT